MIKFYIPHLIFFGVFFVAAVPMLYFYQRKNPNPRCRPTFGEMTMVTVFALALCGGMGMGLGSLFKPENDGSSLKKAPDTAGFSTGGGGDYKSKNQDRKKVKKEKTDLSGGGL